MWGICGLYVGYMWIIYVGYMWVICGLYVGYMWRRVSMYIQVHVGSMSGKEEEGGTDAVADTANRKIQLMVDTPNYDNSSKLKS